MTSRGACTIYSSILTTNFKPLYLGYRIVPDLYCRGGDVTKDNGYGCYLPDGEVEPMGAESYALNHTVPGEETYSICHLCL